MDLIEILDKNLKTKNKIRDILGETNNISRYPVAIHNRLAKNYNDGYEQGYTDRYFELSGYYVSIDGPEMIYDYGVDSTYYEAYTTEILTDIMRDCLNYRLYMKEELETDSDFFVTYPDLLQSKIDSVYDIGYSDGKDKADEDWGEGASVNDPVITNDRNKITISTGQSLARIKFKIWENGNIFEYTNPIIISESCTVYAIALIGLSKSDWVSLSCTYDPTGFVSFVTPPTAEQDGNMVYLSCSMDNCTIEYKIDNKNWTVYTAPFGVTNSDIYLYMRSSRAGEFSATVMHPIKHSIEANRPANVQCAIEDLGETRKITLSCPTSGAEIRYAINDNTGTYLPYSQPVYESSDNFIVYAFAIKDGYESPNRLYFKFDKKTTTVPQDVYFRIDGNSLIISCTTSGSIIYYKLGETGQYNKSNNNNVTIFPPDNTKIYAYAMLNDVPGNVSSITFRKSGSSTIEAPYAWLDENNMILFESPYSVRYTLDGSDPTFGNTWNGTGILISDTTTVKCVAISGTQFSDVKSYTFRPNTGGVTPGGGDTTEELGDKEYFWMTGSDRMETVEAGNLFYYNGSKWSEVKSDTRFDSNNKTYFYGNNISNFRPYYSGKNINIGGNVFSLKDGKNFNDVSSTKSYAGLFKNSSIVNAADLQLVNTAVRSNQYESMFEGCSRLISAPVLSAPTVGTSGYKAMFKNCTSLMNVPNLPATSLGNGCYESMFEGCISITNSDNHIALVSRSLSDSCYASMFKGCTNLQSAPALPADEMKSSCYESMFEGCTSLLQAPYLPATNLAGKTQCYRRMFNGCRQLNYIKAMFLNDPTGNFSEAWVENVANTGTFVKNEAATWNRTGINAVPVNWTIQQGLTTGTVEFDYNKYTGELKLKTTSGDEIWYVYDNQNGEYVQYTQSLYPKKARWIYAKTKNKYGNWGEICSYYINVSYPKLVATIYNGKCSISAAGYSYDSIQYGFSDTEEGTVNQWFNYTGPFTQTEDTWICMRGFVSGENTHVQENWQFLIPSLSAPTFDFIGDNANGTKSYWKIAWNENGDNTGFNPIIWWSLNDYSEGSFINSEACPYTIVIDWTGDDSDRLYYAKAEVTYNGQRVFTTLASAVIKKGEQGQSSITLYEPRFYHIEGNTYGIEYPDENGNWIQYTKWDKDVPKLYYRFGSQEAYDFSIRYPVNTSDYRNKPTYGGDFTAYCWAATSSNNKGTEHAQTLHYDASISIPKPGAPRITIGLNSLNPQQPYKVLITNEYYSGYSMKTYYKIDITETNGDIPSVHNLAVDDYELAPNAIFLPAWVKSAVIYAKTYLYLELVGGEWSDETSKEFTNTFTPTEMVAPGHHFDEDKLSSGKYVLFVDVQDEYTEKYQAGTIYRYFTVKNAEWAPGATRVDFENEYVLNTGFRFATAGSGDFRGGDFEVWWEYHVTGMDPVISEKETFYWRDPNVPAGLQKPDIKAALANGRLKVEITNPNNPSSGPVQYKTYWKIDNCVWAGGVIDTNKYSDIKEWTWNYGLTLDEFLYGGDIIAWSEDDNHQLTDNLKSEYHFYLSDSSLPAPAISFVDKGSYKEILVSNSNKYCTSYFRFDKPGYTTYSVAHKYGNTISSSLSGGCYAYAYSVWGHDKSNTVYAYYDSGISETYLPPVIRCELNPDNVSYSMIVTFKNDSLPRLFWKIDPTEWTGEQVSDSKYKGTTNTEWLVYSKTQGGVIKLSSYLISGTIQVFETNATNAMWSNINTSDNSNVTTYNFVNGRYNQ